MPTFVELTTDPFEDNFRRYYETKDFNPYHRRPRAGLSNVRRPLSGLEIKDDTYAVLKVIRSDGVEVPFTDSAGQKGQTKAYSNFILQSVREARMEKHQIIETFGEPYIYFFGEAPRFLDINAVLINSANFNWKAEWWENWNRVLRGSKSVENGARVYLFYDDNVVEGFMLMATADELSTEPFQVTLQWRMFVTSHRNISLVDDPGFFPEPAVVDINAKDFTYEGGTIGNFIPGTPPPGLPEDNNSRIRNNLEVDDLHRSSIVHLVRRGVSANSFKALADLGIGASFEASADAFAGASSITSSRAFYGFSYRSSSGFSAFSGSRASSSSGSRATAAVLAGASSSAYAGVGSGASAGFSAGASASHNGAFAGSHASASASASAFASASSASGSTSAFAFASARASADSSFGGGFFGQASATASSTHSASASASSGLVTSGGDPKYGYPAPYGGAGHGQAGFGDYGGVGFGSSFGELGDPGHLSPNEFSYKRVASARAEFSAFTGTKRGYGAGFGGVAAAEAQAGVSGSASADVYVSPDAFAMATFIGDLFTSDEEVPDDRIQVITPEDENPDETHGVPLPDYYGGGS